MGSRRIKEPSFGDILDLPLEDFHQNKSDIPMNPSPIKGVLRWLLITISVVIGCIGIYQYNHWHPYFFTSTKLRIKETFNMASLSELHQLGAICNTLHFHECSIKYYKKIVIQDEKDPVALGNLAFNLTEANKHTEALTYYNKLDQMNFLPTPDVCYFRATSLRALNKLEEAFTWFYKGYELSDRYIDNLTALLDLYIELNKPFDALAIVNNYLSKYPSMREYLKRYQIKFTEMAMKDNTNKTSFEVPEYAMHYFVPVFFAQAEEVDSYLVDTGATFITIPSSIKTEYLGSYDSTGQMFNLMSASGHAVKGKLIKLHKIKIGPIELKDINAVLCDNCPKLLGQSVLSQLNTHTKKVSNSNVLVLEKRGS